MKILNNFHFVKNHVPPTDGFCNCLLYCPSWGDILNLLILLFETLEMIKLLFVQNFLKEKIVRRASQYTFDSIVLD